MSSNRWIWLVVIVVVGLTLTGCQSGTAPEDQGQDPANESSTADTAQSPSADASSEDPNSIPISKDDLIGQWQTVSESGDPQGVFYIFNEDETFRIAEETPENAVNQGDFKMDDDGRMVRLYVRNAANDTLTALVPMRPIARKGDEELVFQVIPRDETLWLQRQ